MFNRSRKGKKFTTSDIKKYLDWSVAQTLNGKNISYFVRDSHDVICGGLDLQRVNEKTVTIGYWTDEDKPGFVTNSVNILLGVAKNIGYVSIDAYPEKDNIKSIRVLERAGFGFIEEIVKGDYVLMKYARLL
jgi:RimJ/RimL family protein N-acetyltransferase